MFGLTFGKLLILIAVIAGVWYTVRRFSGGKPFANPLKGRGNPDAVPPAGGSGQQNAGATRPPPNPDAVRAAADLPGEELRKCPTCGTYVPVLNARSCGRSDCPHA